MMQDPWPLFYASRDGHTRRIALYLADQLRVKGIKAQPWDLAQRQPTEDDMPPLGTPVFLMAAIRYGFHLPPARAFIARHHDRLSAGPLALVSVNLTARKPNKRTAQTNLYLRKWIKRSRLSPVITAALGGFLDYPRYGLFDRLMIQLIMTITGGPTDPSARIDYTRWEDVDALATKIADLYDLQKGVIPAQSAQVS